MVKSKRFYGLILAFYGNVQLRSNKSLKKYNLMNLSECLLVLIFHLKSLSFLIKVHWR